MLVEIMKAVVVKFVADLIQKHAAQLWHPCRSISLWCYRDQLDELMCLFEKTVFPLTATMLSLTKRSRASASS